MKRPSPNPEEPESLPRGLVLFPPGTSSKRRWRRLAFAAFYGLVSAALVWPVYPRLVGFLPPILGLPPSLAWVVLVLTVTFVALLALYLSEEEGSAGGDANSARQSADSEGGS